MKRAPVKNVGRGRGWLLFFYSVPSRPVSTRMKVWRRLTKAGALLLKGAVYVLPFTDEHYEFLQWLVSEVSSLRGEAAFTRVEAIDSMKDQEIIDLFDRHKEAEYQPISKALEDLDTKVNSIRKGSGSQNLKALFEQVNKLSRSFDEVRKTDFFSSKAGSLSQSRIAVLNVAIKGLSGVAAETKPAAIPSRKLEDYQEKVWVSRKRPFVDRMASAWLIKRFIDKHAAFKLVAEKDIAVTETRHVTFDVSGGLFTHVGDLCTFEVLARAFGIKDKAVRKMAEIVHELDIKDEKYKSAEAKGLEDILTGIRKTAKDDRDALERGMQVFEMLYVSRS